VQTGRRACALALAHAFTAAPGAPALPPAGTPLTHFLSLFLEALQLDSPNVADAVRRVNVDCGAGRCIFACDADDAPCCGLLLCVFLSLPQLRARYERALARDPSLEEALDRAAAARWPEEYADAGGGAFGGGGLGALLAQLTAM
jgi:hypothetical protein